MSIIRAITVASFIFVSPQLMALDYPGGRLGGSVGGGSTEPGYNGQAGDLDPNKPVSNGRGERQFSRTFGGKPSNISVGSNQVVMETREALGSGRFEIILISFNPNDAAQKFTADNCLKLMLLAKSDKVSQVRVTGVADVQDSIVNFKAGNATCMYTNDKNVPE